MRPLDLMAAAGLAFVLAAAGTALCERLARRWGVVDRPARHKHHRRPTPLLGGAAIVAAVAATALWLPPLGGREGWGLAAAAAILFLAGVRDDVRGLSVLAKLAAQVAAAGVLLASGWVADLPFAAAPLTLLWIVGVTNALNLLDNMDGAAAAVTAAAAGSYTLFLMPDPAAGPAAALLGAAAGFLIFNFPPARIFMGDAGSLFLGMSLAVLALRAQGTPGAPDLFAASSAAVLVLGVPIFDTTLVTVSRLRRGRNPLTTPGKDHLAHRLLELGWSERVAVAVLGGLGTALGGLAWAVRSGRIPAGWLVLAAVAAGAGALVRLELVPQRPRADSAEGRRPEGRG